MVVYVLRDIRVILHELLNLELLTWHKTWLFMVCAIFSTGLKYSNCGLTRQCVHCRDNSFRQQVVLCSVK